MGAAATVSDTFAIAIPKAIRDAQGWEVGQKLVFIPKGEGVFLMPAPELSQLLGLVAPNSDEDYRDRNDRT